MAPARPYWKGHLKLSLVSFPVELYSATAGSTKISFHQIHEPTGKRVRYDKTVPGVGPVVGVDRENGIVNVSTAPEKMGHGGTGENLPYVFPYVPPIA